MNGAALFAEVFDLFLGQAGLQAAADDGNGGGHRAVLADDLLHIQGRLHVLGIGHAMGDNGGFQRHNGLPGGDGSGDLGIDVQILIHVHMLQFLSK